MTHGKANALDVELCDALTEQLDACRQSPDRAIVLTGTGRMFSAGVDLLRVLDGGAAYVRSFLPGLGRMLASLFSLQKPVVAAINGHAIAGGCVLACAADRRLMAREAGHIGVTELLVGVPFPPAAMEIMRAAVAPQYFEDTILSGATFAPPEAVTRGLVHDIVEPDALLDRAIAAATTLAALPPAAFALTKRQLRAPTIERLDDKKVDAAIARIWEAPETLGRVRDYVERTLRKS
jgi:enoyl-CoA hydratase